MSLFITLFVLYALVLLVYGLRRQGWKDPKPGPVFFGSNPLGTWSMTATTTASWFGAATFLITFEAADQKGFSSLWALGVPTLLTLGIFLILTPRIRTLGLTSLAHFFRLHYGPVFAAFVTLLVAAYMTLLAASQFSAWGQIAPLFDMTPASAILTGAACVILYSAFGGFRSVVGTDRLQLFLLSAGVIVLLTTAFIYPTPAPLEPSDFDMTRDLGGHLAGTLCFTLAWTISPIIWQRISACDSSRSARSGLALAMLIFTLLITAVALAAILWRSAREPGVPSLLTLRRSLPTGLGLVIELGLVSAIMSTADTALNTGALTLQPFTNRGWLKGWSHWNLRGAGVLLVGTCAVWIALRHQSILTLLGLAGELMSSGLFVPGIMALVRKRKNPLAGGLSLIWGGGFAVISFFVQTSAGPSFWPRWPLSSLLGIGLSLAGYLTGLLLSRVQWSRFCSCGR